MVFVPKIFFCKLIIMSLVIITVTKGTAKQVQLFESEGFEGLIWQGFASSNCNNVPSGGSSRASSIVAGVCITLFTNTGCRASRSYPSITLPAGIYSNLSLVGHPTKKFNDAVQSFQECFEEPSHVQIFDASIWLAEYYDIRGCINIPSYALGHVQSVKNFGTCVTLFENPNCMGDSVTLLGGVSQESENLGSVSFGGRTSSLALCEKPLIKSEL